MLQGQGLRGAGGGCNGGETSNPGGELRGERGGALEQGTKVQVGMPSPREGDRMWKYGLAGGKGMQGRREQSSL